LKLEKNHGFLKEFSLDFWEKSNIFQHSFADISAICWPILMKNSVLEMLLAIDYMSEIYLIWLLIDK
jgi:hypothetical protein